MVKFYVMQIANPADTTEYLFFLEKYNEKQATDFRLEILHPYI